MGEARQKFEESFANIHQRLVLTADITETKGLLATVEYKVELKKV